MSVFKPLLTILFLGAACLPALPGRAVAEQRYISDTIRISLREGPGTQYKPIKTLQTGQSFEVLETQKDFLRIKTPEGDEGWVQSYFTSDTQSPGAALVKDLNDKIATLTAQNDQLTAQLAGKDGEVGKSAGDQAAPELKKAHAELAELNRRYKQLEADAKDVSPIRAECDALKAEVKTLQETVVQLTTQNSALARWRDIYCFLAGGAVFWLGSMAGRAAFRRQRHSLTL